MPFLNVNMFRICPTPPHPTIQNNKKLMNNLSNENIDDIIHNSTDMNIDMRYVGKGVRYRQHKKDILNG